LIVSEVNSIKMSQRQDQEEFLEEILYESNESEKSKKSRREKMSHKFFEADFSQALKSVEQGMTTNAASRKFNIPWSTLKRHAAGQVSKPGRTTVLDSEIENKLAEWIILNARMGQPREKNEVTDAARDLSLKNVDPLKRFGTADGRPSDKWYKKFLLRHPRISIRTPQSVTRSSANVSEEDIRRFFSKFQSFLEEEGLSHCMLDPSRILNSDEKGFDLNPKPSKVLAERGAQNVFKVESAKPKQRVSVMYTFAANGISYRPQIILKSGLRKTPDVAYALGSK
jgi:hypothetical protein